MEARCLHNSSMRDAGGWQQTQKIWTGRDDPEYRKLAELVEACIVRKPNENTGGWEPSFEQGGGEEWVRKERESYLQKVTGSTSGRSRSSAASQQRSTAGESVNVLR